MTKRLSARQLRENLGHRIDVTPFADEPTHGEPRAARVSCTWWAERQD
ncbi:hypothetical protein [Streptosporangium sp. NPDC006930]